MPLGVGNAALHSRCAWDLEISMRLLYVAKIARQTPYVRGREERCCIAAARKYTVFTDMQCGNGTLQEQCFWEMRCVSVKSTAFVVLIENNIVRVHWRWLR